ncbi:hypothetical protein [Streptomyces sp. NPDC047043]|uniref:hypothetical protein n=1 Tax=Streptomyces sp. NPDC047043 TaxID=3154497 RepID=UPI0033DE631F
MMVRRFSLAIAGSITAITFVLLTACSTPAHSTPSTADATTAPAAGSVKTQPPSQLCTALTVDAARQLIADARPTAQVGPDRGDAPDVCGYAAADGTSILSLTPATRTYAAELSATHDLSAHPTPAGMRDVRVDPVSDLGRQAFRETAHQVRTRQHIIFVVWNSGARTWVLSFATTADTSTKSATVSDDRVVRVARSVTAKLAAGR